MVLIVRGKVLFGDQIRKFATIKAEIQDFSFNHSTKTYEKKVLFTFVYIPCSQIKDPTILKLLDQINSVARQMIDAILCPDFKGNALEYLTYDDPLSSRYRVPVLKVYPCSLPDPSLCASQLEVKYTQLLHARMNKLFISSDMKNPVILMPRLIADLQFDNFQKKNHFYSVKLNRIFDDTSNLKKPHLQKEYATYELDYVDSNLRDPTQLHCQASGPNGELPPSCIEYVSITFQATGKIEIIRRGYRKITNVLGEFGGSMKLLTSSFFLFYSFYRIWNLRKFIAERLYDYGSEKKDSSRRFIKQRKFRKNKVVPSTKSLLELHLWGNRQSRVLGRNKQSSVPVPELEQNNRMKGVSVSDQSPTPDEIMKNLVKSKLSCLTMMSNLDFVELLQNMVMDEENKKLIPLVIMKLKQNQLQDSKAKELGERKAFVDLSSRANTTKKDFISKYEKAYQKVRRNAHHENGFKAILSGYMVDQVSELFDQGGLSDYQPEVGIAGIPKTKKTKEKKL